jgi:uncharacterized protein with HEPN domain
MPPTLADRLEHILVAIDTIQNALSNKRLEELTADLLLRLAVERSFEIICEASRRIPDSVKEQQPDINWRRMLDFGNQLRHAYHAIESQILWEIAQRDLPPLRKFIEDVMRESSGKRPD